MKLIRILSATLASALLAAAQDTPVGSVAGSVFDASTGQPVRQVRIEVDGHSDKRMQTDTSGRFRIELTPGTYKLRFTADNYNETVVDAIAVVAGEVVEASTVMSNKASVTTIDVVEKVGAVAATAEAMLTERKLSGVVSDAISREELRSGVASNAAGALEKVTGVSIVDNGFVYVRGLGERYSATMLNSAMIPTTEPEKRVVPLDLFPAALIDSIKILKTYTPDLPGEFAGGLVQMTTVEFPNAKVFRVSTNFGFNTRTTFDRFLTQRGGGLDAFGFDDGSRSLPALVPRNDRVFPGRFSEQQLVDIGRSFPVDWEPGATDSMRPAQSYSVVGGGTFGRFGIVGAITFTNKPQRYDEQRNYLRNAGNSTPVIFTSYPNYMDSTESVRMGGVLNLAIRLNTSNKIVFRNTLTRDSDKETRILSGYTSTLDSNVSTERMRWVERGLKSTSVEGEHSVALLGSSLFKWQFTYSASNRSEPDLREIIRGDTGEGRYIFLAQGQSGFRFFNQLDDRIYEPQAEWGKPFYKGSVSGMFKLGFRATLRSRDFEARRFRFVPTRTGTLDVTAASNILFASTNIRPDGFVIREETRGTDTYTGDMDIYGGYAMVDLAIGPKWRVVGGIRFEDAAIGVRTIDPFVPGQQPAISTLNNRDPLPGVNLIYALNGRQNLRFSYSRTVSRPDFRELSPFEFTNVVGGFSTLGNPNLRRATIENYDARWEWFPGGNQIVAASYFYKKFTDPIEVSIQATADLRQSFLNAKGAKNQGIELEYRQNLGWLGPRFRPFSLQTNFTMVDSNIELPEGEALLLTSRNRALMGQSRYIYNVIGEWVRPQWHSNARFYLNSVSRRITDVGTFGLPDIYQERNTFMDVVYQYDVVESGRWSLRFGAENIGDNKYRWTQAAIPVRAFQMGRTFTAGTSFSIF